MTDSDIYSAVRAIVSAVTGLPSIIPANDSENAPTGSYASIRVASARSQRGQSAINLSHTDLVSSPIGDVHDINLEVKSQILCDVEINFYRTGATEYASMMFGANKLPSISELLFNAGIGWRKPSAINNLSALQSGDIEDRAMITLHLTYEQSLSVVTNAIYDIPVSVENENGDILQTDLAGA